MKIKIYSIPDCTWCSKAERLLKMAGITDYEKHTVGDEGEVDFQYIRNHYPNNTGFPIIEVNNKVIDGIIDLAKILINAGLISSKKKNE